MVKRMKNRRSRPKFLRVSSSCSSSSSFLHLSSCSSSCSLYPFFFSFSRGFSSAGRASRGSLFAAAKALKLKDKAGNFLSSFPRSFLRLFFLHFDPPASSPYPAPSFSSKRQFLRYRLLQWSQHLRQKKLYGDLLTGGEPKTRTRSRRRGQEEEEDQTKALPLSFLFSLLPSFSSSSSSLSRLRSSSSFSFFDPRWRPPALWPSFRPLPSSRPPPEVVAHEHRREKDGLCQRERKKRQEEEAEEEGGKPTLTEVCPDAARREGKSFLSSSSSFSSLSSSSAMPLRVQCIGHGTFLLQCGGLNVLTDPIFAYKAGPYGVLGVPRVSQPGVCFEDLPPIDVVLLSSVRYDAYDYPTLKRLAKRDGSTFFVPQGAYCRRYLPPRLFGNVYPVTWGDRVKFGRNFLVFFSPAIHASVGRYGWDAGMPGWGSFVLVWMSPQGDEKKTVYFGGRSAYSRRMFNLIREATLNDVKHFAREAKEEDSYQRHLEDLRKRRRRREGEGRASVESLDEEEEEEERTVYLLESDEKARKKKKKELKRLHETDEGRTGQKKNGEPLDRLREEEEEEKGGGGGGEKKKEEEGNFVFDLSILPIGGYEPRQYMYRYQMFPEEAVEAHLALESRLSIPSYHDVFPIGGEDFGEAPERLRRSCELRDVKLFADIPDVDAFGKKSCHGALSSLEKGGAVFPLHGEKSGHEDSPRKLSGPEGEKNGEKKGHDTCHLRPSSSSSSFGGDGGEGCGRFLLLSPGAHVLL